MNKIKKALLSVLLVPVLFAPAVVFSGGAAVQAQTTEAEPNVICRIFPFIYDIDFTRGLCGTTDEGDALDSIEQLGAFVRFALSLIFIGIIVVAVFYIIKASIKYIRSEGDEGEIEASTKAIKSVFIGLGVLIAGIVGLVVLIAFIGAEDALNQDVESGTSLDRFLNAFLGGN